MQKGVGSIRLKFGSAARDKLLRLSDTKKELILNMKKSEEALST